MILSPRRGERARRWRKVPEAYRTIREVAGFAGFAAACAALLGNALSPDPAPQAGRRPTLLSTRRHRAAEAHPAPACTMKATRSRASRSSSRSRAFRRCRAAPALDSGPPAELANGGAPPAGSSDGAGMSSARAQAFRRRSRGAARSAGRRSWTPDESLRKRARRARDAARSTAPHCVARRRSL